VHLFDVLIASDGHLRRAAVVTSRRRRQLNAIVNLPPTNVDHQSLFFPARPFSLSLW
jgi:hypothetical protein